MHKECAKTLSIDITSISEICSCNWQYWQQLVSCDGWNCLFMELLTQMQFIVCVKWITCLNYDTNRMKFQKLSYLKGKTNTHESNYYINEFMFMKNAHIKNEFLVKLKPMTLLNLTTWILMHVKRHAYFHISFDM